MENVSIVGVDLSKEVFQVCMMNHVGKVIRQEKVSRVKFLEVMRKVPRGSEVYMEPTIQQLQWRTRMHA